MSGEFNPYASPAAVNYKVRREIPVKSGGPRELASYGQRLVGAIIDRIAAAIFLLPVYSILFGRARSTHPTDTSTVLPYFIVGGLALACLQIYLLAMYSQSLGKLAVRTRIVDFQTGEPAGLVKSYLLRSLLNGLICCVPCAGGLYALLDILSVFSRERRCLHDFLAGTDVVDIS
ncbi:MAG: RDD family protein [Pirellulales bacterium]